MRPLALAALLWAAGCDAPGEPAVFIALQRDFAPFESWPRVSLGDGAGEGHAAGARHVYHNRGPHRGRYPVGTILVKAVETTAPFTTWELFGMVKRGGGFNADGALDWEFFTLRFDAGRVPVIVARGENPKEAAEGAHGYEDGGSGVTCNRCHGTLAAPTDHVLSPALSPAL